MKKISKIALVAIMMFVAMGSVFAAEKVVKVSSWEKFVTMFSTAKYDKNNTYVIQLSKDIECPAPGKIQGFSASDATRVAIEVPTGTVIDLNGKKIKCATNSVEFIGTGFTIKNGTFDVSGAAISNGYYALVISSMGYTGASADAQTASKDFGVTDAEKWAKRVIIDGITAPGAFLTQVTAEIKNCTFVDAAYRGITMWGSSGTIENSVVTSKSTNGALVCKFANEFYIKSNVTIKGSKALQLDSECYVEVVADAKNVVLEAVGYSGLKIDCPAPIYMVAASDILKIKAPITIKASLSNYIVTDKTKANNCSIAAGSTILDENGKACEVGVIQANVGYIF